MSFLDRCSFNQNTANLLRPTKKPTRQNNANSSTAERHVAPKPCTNRSHQNNTTPAPKQQRTYPICSLGPNLSMWSLCLRSRDQRSSYMPISLLSPNDMLFEKLIYSHSWQNISNWCTINVVFMIELLWLHPTCLMRIVNHSRLLNYINQGR